MNTKKHKIAIAAFLFLIIGTVEMHPILKYMLLGVATINSIVVTAQIYSRYIGHPVSKQKNND